MTDTPILELFTEQRSMHTGRTTYHPSVALRRNAPDTSRQAALKLVRDPEKLGKQAQAVFDTILAGGLGGATDDEIADALDLDGNSVRPRRNDLVNKGRVVDSGERRRNKRGNECVVWICAARFLFPSNNSPTGGGLGAA